MISPSNKLEALSNIFSLEVSDIGAGGKGKPTYDIVDGSEIRNNHLGCINRRNSRINMDKLPTSTGDPRISEPSTVYLPILSPNLGARSKETLSKHKPFTSCAYHLLYLLLFISSRFGLV